MLRMLRDFAYRYPYRLFILLALLGFGIHYTAQSLDTEQHDSRGRTRLIQAAEAGDMAEVVQLLSAAGAARELRDGEGMTALDWVRREKRDAVVAVLESAP